MLIGFLEFVSLTKHKDGDVNTLDVVSTNDDDKIELPVKGRSRHRKKMKLLKDNERSRATSSDDERSLFTQRGLSVDTRLQMTEMAQIEHSKNIETLVTTASLHNDHLELLLTEWSQATDLAKIVCPGHDKLDEDGIVVMDLSKSMSNAKKDVKDYFQERALLLSTESGSTTLASSFFSSVTKSYWSEKEDTPTIVLFYVLN